MSPTSALIRSRKAVSWFTMNFAIGPFKPSSSTLIHAKPLAPNLETKSAKLSASLREYSSASPFKLMTLTSPPFSIHELNTLRSDSFMMSLTSINSKSKRVSGLSFP